MEKNVKLIYTLDKKTIILKEDTLNQIDTITTKYNKEELIIRFKKEIDEFINNKDLSKGKFTIINENKNIIKVLYKKHKELFYLLINDEKFLEYLDKNYTGIDAFFDDCVKYQYYSNKIVRKICKIYREEYKKQDKIKKLGGM